MKIFLTLTVPVKITKIFNYVIQQNPDDERELEFAKVQNLASLKILNSDSVGVQI